MVDYHTHTTLCGHAVGSMDEYVEAAISNGIAELGFADHAPMPEDLRRGIAMSASEAEPYIDAVAGCRDRYRGRISIRTGFEVDFPLMETFNRGYLADPRIDYLIGSCHYIDGWGFDNPLHMGGYAERSIDEIYGRYFAILKSLAASGHFNIISHFDIVKKFGHRATRDFLPEIRSIARVMADADVAFEVNTAGMIHPANEMYPADDIIQAFFDAHVPATLGSDSHKPEQVGYLFSEAIEKLRKAGYRKISGFLKRKRYDIPL